MRPVTQQGNVFSLLEHQILLSAVITYLIAAASFRAVKWSVSAPTKKIKGSFRQNMREYWENTGFEVFCWCLKEGQCIHNYRLAPNCTKLVLPLLKKILTSSAPSFQICLAALQSLTVPFSSLLFLPFFSLTFLWLPVILTLELTTQPYPTEFGCMVVCTSPLKQNRKHDNMAFSSRGKK